MDCDGECLNDADGDGVCDEDEIPGCTDELANNYDASATDDDGSCTGCTNLIADNYYDGADVDDGTCIISGVPILMPAILCSDNEDGTNTRLTSMVSDMDCNGGCLNDLDRDEICNEDEL